MPAVLPPIPLHFLVICEGQLLQGSCNEGPVAGFCNKGPVAGFCNKGPVAGFLLYLLYTDEVDRALDAANAVSG